MSLLYAGDDLNASNNFLGIVKNHKERIFHRRLPNDLNVILKVLEPFREDLGGIAVESTYNWYWLVDGLMEAGSKVHLANSSAIKKYEGLKHSDDEDDAYWLGEMLALDILPEGYIYPKEERPIRDLLRKRVLLKKHSTAHQLNLGEYILRCTGFRINSNEIKKVDDRTLRKIFKDENSFMYAKASSDSIRFLQKEIKMIEREVKPQIKLHGYFKRLLEFDGIGDILGMTIMLEVGDINRFKKAGNFVSYCRCVKSSWESNSKVKGKGNKKNGNKYLAWAFVEAAIYSIRFSDRVRRYYNRKMAKTNRIVAIKAIAAKLARAAYYVMINNVPYKEELVFGK